MPLKLSNARAYAAVEFEGWHGLLQREGAVESIFSFGAWLQQRRKALDMTQADLARRVGCSVELIRKKIGRASCRERV